MTIEQRARDLASACKSDFRAICVAIQGSDDAQADFAAYRQRVSDAMVVLREYLSTAVSVVEVIATPIGCVDFADFIIPEPVDPLTAAFPATMKVILYHESGGHEGDGSDDALRQARDELAKIGGKVVFGEGV